MSLALPETETLMDRVAVDPEGCWQWTGGKTVSGYGQVRRRGRSGYAHRIFYERARGPIPDGLQIHHRCGNRSCVNPEHLEPLTQRDHSRAHRITHCVHGHLYDEVNTLYANQKTPRGYIRRRYCRTCANERRRS